jgi:hypothetical protein
VIEDNRLLRRQLGPRRLHLIDDDRPRLAARAYRVGRAVLREIATIETPDTLLRWRRQLIARKWTYAGKPEPRGVLLEIRRLVVRMAEENPTWGSTRMQGAPEERGAPRVNPALPPPTLSRPVRARTQDCHESRAAWNACLVINPMEKKLHRVDSLSKPVGDLLVRESIR